MIKLFRFLLGINPPCIHNWQVLVKETVPSRFEIMNSNPRSLSCQSFPLDLEKMCFKETIIIVKCDKCGELKKIYTANVS